MCAYILCPGDCERSCPSRPFYDSVANSFASSFGWCMVTLPGSNAMLTSVSDVASRTFVSVMCMLVNVHVELLVEF